MANNNLDLVFIIDATGSMCRYIEIVKKVTTIQKFFLANNYFNF